MLVLGIETSGDVTGVAVVDGGGVLAEISFRHAMQLSSSLAPRIQDVLRLAGVSVRDLGGVAVSQGPGSFTGLRIGVSAAKGLAFAAGIPIAAVSTLEAVAVDHPVPGGARVWAVLAASKSDIFAAQFQWVDGSPRQVQEPAVVATAQLADRLQQHPDELLASGPLGPHLALFAQAAGSRLLTTAHLAIPRPATIAVLGRERILQGKADAVHAVAPRYLLLSAAEARRSTIGAAP